MPRLAVYDNLKPAVHRLLAGHSRREQEAFLHFQSIYRFEALFANPHAGWEKGSVENLVSYARRNYLVPLPEGVSLEAINEQLRASCLADQQRTMAGRTEPITPRLERERLSLGPLPTHAPELGPVVEVLVHSTGRVRFQTNDYSVPIQYAYQRLTLKADPFRVRLFAGEEPMAEHARCAFPSLRIPVCSGAEWKGWLRVSDRAWVVQEKTLPPASPRDVRFTSAPDYPRLPSLPDRPRAVAIPRLLDPAFGMGDHAPAC